MDSNNYRTSNENPMKYSWFAAHDCFNSSLENIEMLQKSSIAVLKSSRTDVFLIRIAISIRFD